MARALAASSRSLPCCRPKRMMPSTARYPCSGVRAAPQDAVHELAGRGTGLLGPAEEARRRPLGVGAVDARHVLGDGGRLPVVAAPVGTSPADP